MWARAILVSGTLALVASAPAYAAPVYSSRLVLGYAQGVSPDRAAQAVERHGGRVLRRFAGVRGAVVQARGGLAAHAPLRRLRDGGGLPYAERDYPVSTPETPHHPPPA